MAIHCIDVVYSPSQNMDSYLETWLNGWTAWSKEPFESPSSMTFTEIDSGSQVSASGFRQNRFQLDSSDHANIIEADVANNTITVDKGMTGNIVGGETFQLRRDNQREEVHTVSDFTSNGDGTTTITLESLTTRNENQTVEERESELVDGTTFFSQYIVSNLIGQTGYLASYCDWWVVRSHVCDHDQSEKKGCGGWYTIDKSDNYSGFSDVPSEVNM